MNKYGVIYMIKNNINNKVYIGQTKNNFNLRYGFCGTGAERVLKFHETKKSKHKYYNKHLLAAILKYGVENFTVIKELDVAFSPEELNEKEMYYINLYDSFHNGYNKNSGGNGNRGCYGQLNHFYGKTHSLETRNKLRQLNLGKKASLDIKLKMSINNGRYWKGKGLPLEIRKKISETRIKNGKSKGKNNPMHGVSLPGHWKGKKLPIEMIEKRTATLKKNRTFIGKNNPSARKIICITDNLIFDTMKEAAGYYNLNGITGICSCCKGNLKSSGKNKEGKKLIWKYYEE